MFALVLFRDGRSRFLVLCFSQDGDASIGPVSGDGALVEVGDADEEVAALRCGRLLACVVSSCAACSYRQSSVVVVLFCYVFSSRRGHLRFAPLSWRQAGVDFHPDIFGDGPEDFPCLLLLLRSMLWFSAVQVGALLPRDDAVAVRVVLCGDSSCFPRLLFVVTGCGCVHGFCCRR